MSYILDALRKSDQQRQRGAAPTLLMGQLTEAAPKQPGYLSYGLLAATLLGAGVVIGWLHPWEAEQALPGKADPVAVKPPESTLRRAAAPAETVSPRKLELPLQNAASPAQAALVPVPAKPPAPAQPEARRTPAETVAAAPKKTAARAQPIGPAANAAPLQTLLAMAELPLSVQQELPAMTISVHAYSANSRDRMVSINNRMLREGADVAPGLKLEQITPDGMVFGYKGYRFRRGVK